MLAAILLLQSPPIARISLAAIDEGSGIVASRRYPGVFWTHNDSGDSARFFAIRADGTAVMPKKYNRKEDAGAAAPPPSPFEGIKVEVAQNIDWEDIAYDGETLYLADTGNNANARRDLGVYAVQEPNPAETERTRPYAWYPVEYPEQKAFPPLEGDLLWDCEAVFHLRGKLYFLTKTRSPQGIPKGISRLYRLDDPKTDKVNSLRFLDAKSDFGGWVTAADASPDGKRLAVLTHFPQAAVWLFDAKAPGDKFLSRPLKTIPLTNAGQCEAICFEPDGNSVLVTNEGRDIFRIAL
ncbi:hypothetical protein EON81_13065 [bacterium]|nr:MAG: hypothetical protein EON81_13065 [bacterium]